MIVGTTAFNRSWCDIRDSGFGGHKGGYGKASVAADMLKVAPAALSTFGMFLYELRDRQLWTLDTVAR
jgi:hypothetical protein